MVSFRVLYHKLLESEQETESKAVEAIRRGQDHSSADPDNFWNIFVEKFRTIPSELLADLLGISPEQVSRMSSNVQKALDQVSQNNSQGNEGGKSKVLKTGFDLKNNLGGDNE